ncbi:MAG: PilT/PilU family type 4a pilus ATPase [Deltaproteobacteria bacterium]|nr:PilT/PilU family type 4a pilus ATPase [Deltaproteobacteria bacterium]MBW1919557.1 PilT/PilU family type 4a pilus ATPase [Deltaproteobacteria bacterium]MBW1934974.1 PilT/PilU family type 4a pilus ATPase [Deltaproteobacteria bacterium]MBW1977862.1 PilT/PilU family type 4a pilus ATPase [Deltaproteobacteria bacterium]MBW2045021.1 PilT/PilU family type 4a pilus ATPase [Deltaproteobacteria bacterium]
MRRQEIDHILTAMLESHDNVSDLNITVEKPFQVESAGELKPVSLNPPIDRITPFQSEILALNLINGDRRLTKMLLTHGSCDTSYQLAGKARFRVNIFSQRGYYSTVMRQLATRVPTIEEMGLPKAFHMMSEERNGIILITGATGSGKSTSLAAILNEVNEKKSVHVVTLEDPVEYVHAQKKSTFNQRELGVDFDTFANGLRAALRQAPKIILVGEMRDRETVEIGLSAAETGHLVLTTLHTVDAGQTINRIVGMFERDEERQIRIRLSDSIRWIACQRLLPKVGGGRVAAFEILRANLRAKDAILHGESEGKTFYEIIEQSRPFGMMTFDQCISELYEKGLITEQTAMSFASRKAVVGRAIDAIKASRGEKTTTIEGLRLDTEYGKKHSR